MIPAPLLAPALGAAALAAVAATGFAWLRLIHDPAIRAEYRTELDAQVAAVRLADQEHALQAMASLEAEHRAQLAAATTTRERIIRVPVTTSCMASPAVAVALGGLRDAASGGRAPGSAPGNAGLPGRPPSSTANR